MTVPHTWIGAGPACRTQDSWRVTGSWAGGSHLPAGLLGREACTPVLVQLDGHVERPLKESSKPWCAGGA